MWVLSIAGPVHGQNQFTFALEQHRTYTVGRDGGNDITINDARIRPKDGVIEVGLWDPTNHDTTPELAYRILPKRNDTVPPHKIVEFIGNEYTSTDKTDYTFTDGNGAGEVALTSGKGLQLTPDTWFAAHWEPIHFSYDRIDAEPDEATKQETQEALRKYCISYTKEFQADDRPHIVVTEDYRGSNDCLSAVIFGTPMVSPKWLEMLMSRLRVCWRKVADAQDSFVVPNFADDDNYEPKWDPARNSLKAAQAHKDFWMPPRDNSELWSKYLVIGVRTKRNLARDQKFFNLMGAVWREVNVCAPPVVSGNDFLDRIDAFVQEAATMDRKAMVITFGTTKKDMGDRNIDMDAVIRDPCLERGDVMVSPGSIMWGSILSHGVEAFMESKKAPADAPAPSAAPSTAATAAVPPTPVTQAEPAEPARRLTRRATSRQPSPPPPPSAQPDKVVSSFPDDTAPQPTPAAASTAKKPLKRRVGRAAQAVNIWDSDDDMGSAEATQGPSSSMPSRIPETQLSEAGPSLASHVPDSMDVGPSQPSPRPTRTSRLKRRAGATQPSLFDGDVSIDYEQQLEREEKDTQNRQLYEELRRGASPSMASMPPPKRPRLAAVAEAESLPSSSRESPAAESMDIDEDDFVTKTIRNARNAKLKRSASPAKRATPAAVTKDEEEEEEEVEEPIEREKRVKRGGNEKKEKVSSAKPHEVTRDEGFLQIINANRKKAMDDLDREFNELRIPKPQRQARPDYSILNNVAAEELVGNFIVTVKRNLMRADPPKVAEVADDGKPNFKKFKKKNIVRREPISLMVATHNAQAEMGEPYWAYEKKQLKSQPSAAKSQPSQATAPTSRGRFASTIDEEDDVPLLPKPTRRRLAKDDSDDDDEITALPAGRRRGATPATQSQAPARGVRGSRAGSTVSEVSSTATPAPTAMRATGRTTTQRAAAGRSKKVIEILDSDEDQPLFTAPSAPAASASTRSTRARGAAAAGPSAVTATLSEAPSTSARGTRASTRATTQSTRRKLLADDSDDDSTAAFKGVQKKRRLG